MTQRHCQPNKQDSFPKSRVITMTCASTVMTRKKKVFPRSYSQRSVERNGGGEEEAEHWGWGVRGEGLRKNKTRLLSRRHSQSSLPSRAVEGVCVSVQEACVPSSYHCVYEKSQD